MKDAIVGEKWNWTTFNNLAKKKLFHRRLKYAMLVPNRLAKAFVLAVKDLARRPVSS